LFAFIPSLSFSFPEQREGERIVRRRTNKTRKENRRR
jgi:hypothetical protein